MKTIAIHQPNYIPWLGFFFKIAQVDTFVFLDDVQYSNKAMHDFHYIKNPMGRHRLRIPVKLNFGDLISNVRLNNEILWQDHHLKQLEVNYKKALHFKQVYSDLADIYYQNDINLSDFNIRIIKLISSKFNIPTSFVKSSELPIVAVNKNERILSICNELNASVYYSGTGAAVYQKEIEFCDRGIELRYSTFQPFNYPQFWGEFEANVSVIDYLMHCGYDWDRVMKSTQKVN
jgi:hypothetical protein